MPYPVEFGEQNLVDSALSYVPIFWIDKEPKIYRAFVSLQMVPEDVRDVQHYDTDFEEKLYDMLVTEFKFPKDKSDREAVSRAVQSDWKSPADSENSWFVRINSENFEKIIFDNLQGDVLAYTDLTRKILNIMYPEFLD